MYGIDSKKYARRTKKYATNSLAFNYSITISVSEYFEIFPAISIGKLGEVLNCLQFNLGV